MTNNELLNNLSSETKKYLDDVFSYLDFFLMNEDKLYTKSNGNLVKINDENLLAYSFLLATLKDDNVLQDIFAKNNLDYKKIQEFFNIPIDNVKPIKAEDSTYVKSNSLLELFAEISERLKYNNYLENTDINLSDLKPYQIFDYILETYYETYKELCEEFNIKFESNLALDLCKRIYDYDSDFAKKFGVDIDLETEKELENTFDYDFKNFKIMFDKENAFIIFKDNINLEEGTIISGSCKTEDKKYHNDELSKLINKNEIYILKELYGFKAHELTRENIERIVNNIDSLNPETTVGFESVDGKDFKVVFNTLELFSDRVNKPMSFEEENKLTLSEIMKGVKEEEKYNPVNGYTPYLDKYGFDLTKDKYLKDPSVGREDKIREIEKVLLYPEKDKSIIVTGTAGCGKTALVKGLAYRIQKGDVPNALKNLRIISIDCAGLVAGTKYVGTLEEKMKNILEEASSSKDIVLFMDEIHQALGAGKAEGNDNSVSEILKPYLDYGRARVIGATTDYEYSEYVSQDPAFKTRFKKIAIKEPDNAIVYQVLDDLIESYNKFSYSKLLVSDEEKDMIINWLMDSTIERNRDCRDKSSNPRLVLDIIKDAYALAALNDRTEVSMDDLENALMQEERLYKSSRERQVQKLKQLKPRKHECEIIQFRLKK